MNQSKVPPFLFKLISREDWEESLSTNQVKKSTMDNAFIHLATEEQVDHVANKFWQGKEYLSLKLDPEKLTGNLVLETNPGGITCYYHLYEGTIPLDAVVDVTTMD